MPYAEINGASLYYDEIGTGNKIVIAASGGDFKTVNPEVWPFYLADAGYHVYTITNRGHWKSTHVHEDLGNEWYNIWADDVYAFAKSFGYDRFIYTGLSHGAGIGWHLADRHPECMNAFVAIVCGPHNRSGPETSPARQRTIDAADDPELKARILRDMEPDWSDIPNDMFTQAQARFSEFKKEFEETTPEEMRINPRKPFPWIKTEEELSEKLATIRVPTLMIGGVQDSIISPESMLRSMKSVPGNKCIMYQDGTHNVANEHLEEVKTDILIWLKARGQ